MQRQKGIKHIIISFLDIFPCMLCITECWHAYLRWCLKTRMCFHCLRLYCSVFCLFLTKSFNIIEIPLLSSFTSFSPLSPSFLLHLHHHQRRRQFIYCYILNKRNVCELVLAEYQNLCMKSVFIIFCNYRVRDLFELYNTVEFKLKL
jgi:hypothetical protein